jgi:hypothetical protein
MEFRQKLPGYALDMATNITLILHDLTRLTLSIKNPAKEMLEKQIMMTVGIPYPLPDRYNKNDAKQYDLLAYVRDSQIFYGEEARGKCHKILDYLYPIVTNNEDDAISYLQIQKMDLRTAQAVKIDDTTIALIPSVTGEAEKITNENERKRQPEVAILSIVNECIEKIDKNEFELDDCLKTIDLLQETRENTAMPESYNNLLIGFIARALNNQELNNDTRAELCQIWIDGIKLYFSMGSFIFQYECSEILFAQVESNVCDAIKTQLRQLMLDLIMYDDSNGVVSKIAHFAKRYLTSNNQLAHDAARPKRTKYGEISPYAGFINCLDCGFAMRYQKKQQMFKNGNVATYESYMCGSFSRSGKQACTSHYIPVPLLSKIIIADIRQKAAMLEYDEKDLLEQISERKSTAGKEQIATLNAAKRTADKRHAELERLVQSLYEDKVKGVIPEDVCARLISQYETERQEQSEHAKGLNEQIESFQMEQDNVHEWIDIIRQYRDIEVINRDILAKLINKIEVGERKIIDGQKQREIRIHYKFVGYIG